MVVRLFLGRSEIAVEEHIGAHAKHTIAWPVAITERGWRGEADGGAAIADDERRNRHVQAIEQVRFEEHRYRHAAAFHEDPRAASGAQQPEKLRHIDPVGRVLHANDRGLPERALVSANQGPGADVQSFRIIVAEYAVSVAEPSASFTLWVGLDS